MTAKFLKERWYETDDSKKALNEILKIVRNGVILREESSPFEIKDSKISDFRGINFNDLKRIKKNYVQNADFSHCSFKSVWLEKNVFKNVKFDKTDFSEITEIQNEFNNVSFFRSKFSKSNLGYNGSKYKKCVFDEVNFTTTEFIRNEFDSCSFKNCKLNGTDFNGSSFDNCIFIGELENVWFRGSFPSEFYINKFGNPRKNEMRNVSFENTSLLSVNFSNYCDLSTVKSPLFGNYRMYKNWKQKLEKLKIVIKEWPSLQRNKAEIFVYSYLVHANHQDWFLINADEVIDEYGEKIGEKIFSELKDPVWRSKKQ